MEVTEKQMIEKYGKQSMQCIRNTLLPCDFDWICVVGRYNVITRKKEHTKFRPRKFLSMD